MIILLYAAIGGLLIAIGWTLNATVTEGRHDCMPHDPDHCRDATGETR